MLCVLYAFSIYPRRDRDDPQAPSFLNDNIVDSDEEDELDSDEQHKVVTKRLDELETQLRARRETQVLQRKKLDQLCARHEKDDLGSRVAGLEDKLADMDAKLGKLLELCGNDSQSK